MVNVNLLWAVNVESEMLPMKLKGIATHQRVLKGEVREAFFPHLGLTPSLTERICERICMYCYWMLNASKIIVIFDLRLNLYMYTSFMDDPYKGL